MWLKYNFIGLCIEIKTLTGIDCNENSDKFKKWWTLQMENKQ